MVRVISRLPAFTTLTPRPVSRPPVDCLAEILGDNSWILGLSCVRISLDCVEVRGSSARKRGKNRVKNHVFEKVLLRYDGEIFLYRTQMVP